MIPLFLLLLLALFIMTDSWSALGRMMRVDKGWFAAVIGAVREGDTPKAQAIAKRSKSALGRVMRTGLESANLPAAQIEEDIQVDVRQLLARVEAPVGYLSMVAAVAPMLGFLGTIFGVIRIFINISIMNDLSISSISDGLYQKMICSGAGLLIGILAYCGFYVLNRRIDKLVLLLDTGSNQLLKALAQGRRG